MMTKNADKKREQMMMFCMDDMVPQNHMLRLIDKAIDWTFIYELVEEKFCPDNGRPSMDPVPHFSTFGKNYTRRFKDTDLFEQIFAKILEDCMKFKLVDTDQIFVDSTHVKACANSKKMRKRVAHEQALWYEEKLQKGLKRRNAVPVIRKAAGSVKASINMFSPMQWKQLVINTSGSSDTAFIQGMNMTAGHSKHFMTR